MGQADATKFQNLPISEVIAELKLGASERDLALRASLHCALIVIMDKFEVHFYKGL